MATLVELDYAKKHLRVDADDEDSLIAGQLAAAEMLAMSWIRRRVFATQEDLDAAIAALPESQTTADELQAKPTLNGVVVNDLFIAAVLLTLGSLYMNREVVEPPTAAQWLLDSLRFYG